MGEDELGRTLAVGLAASRDPAMVLNAEGIVRWANPAAAEAFGSGDLAGQCLVEVVDVLTRDALQAGLAAAVRGQPARLTLFTVNPPLEMEATLSPTGPLVLFMASPSLLPMAVADRLTDINRRYLEKVKELATLTGRLREAAVTDALTNLFNRRAFLERAETEWARAHRHGQKLSLLVLDIDHFKSVNDRYGHAVGDEVLRHFAVLLRTTVRASDLPARLGGEEFVVLLPNSDVHGATLLAERMRQRLVDQPVETSAGTIVVTCSAGIASAASHANVAETLASADRALYEAKEAGRDCVRVAKGPSGAAA